MYVIDSDTMTLISTVPLQGDVWDVAVSRDGKLHAATSRGVRVYTADGTYMYTGQSYLDELTCMSSSECMSITCTINGYSIVGMMYRVAVVSSDLTSVHYISTGRMGYEHVVCNAVDNSLVVWNYDYSHVVVVPLEVYQPPFSLFTLCVSTIILYKNELPISLLPPRLYKLILKYTNTKH